jgi:hypothetical protein
MGHRHPKIQQAIRAATEKFGYVWEGMTTEYRAAQPVTLGSVELDALHGALETVKRVISGFSC